MRLTITLSSVVTLAACAGALALAPAAFGQVLANPSMVSGNGRATVGAVLAKSDIDYELSRTREIDRTILGFEAGFGVTPAVDIFGQLGLITDAEYENLDKDGKGYMIGAGVRARVYQGPKVRAHFFALFNYLKETYKDIPLGAYRADLEVKLTELQLGGLVSYPLNATMDVYGGLDLVPMTDGKAKVSVSAPTYPIGVDRDHDIERDDMINLRIGANFRFDRLTVHPEIVFLGETTLLGGASYTF